MNFIKAFLLALFFAGCNSINLSGQTPVITKDYGKYGLVTHNGVVLVKHIYDRIEPFDKYNHSVVSAYNGKFGVIDINGNIILDVVYTKIGAFNQGFAIISHKDKFGIINEKHQVILKASYDSITSFEGKTTILKAKKNDQSFYINKLGQIISN